ncbi:amidohydrolase family protein [Luteimonas sp. MC1895]|uniref:amidohydrolase family protein n=1 Tax=Luteimonas sp. MC1895 TaxID=2819513 RepID=UPI0031BAE117
MITLTLILGLLASAGSVAGDLAIVGACIHPAPDAATIEGGTVLVRAGRIVAVGRDADVRVPDGVRVIDAAGRVVTAGFWNSHVHLMAPEFGNDPPRPAAEVDAVLQAMFTRWGFTTVFDIASFGGNAAALRTRIDAGEVQGPRVLTVDAPFFPEGGTPIYIRDLLARMGVASGEVADAASATLRADRQLAAGADGVKIFAGAIVGGETGVLPMDTGVARAVVDAAHRAGRPAFAHPSNAAGMEVSLAAGLDVLAHTAPFMGPWDAPLVARLRAAGVALTPTLTLFEVELAREGLPRETVEAALGNALAQLRAFFAAGGPVLFGTDVGYIDHVDTRREFELMALAGMDWRAILASLTTAPAARFGQGDASGRVQPGMRADLVLLRGDPADRVAAFAEVAMTVRDGVVIHDDRAARGTPISHVISPVELP